MNETSRYYAAACQTDLPSPRDRDGIAGRRPLAGHDRSGGARLRPVLPRAARRVPRVRPRRPDLRPTAEVHDRLAVPIPNEHTDRYVEKAREQGIYIQTGSFLEGDRRYPGHVFNTTCLIGPDGLLRRYRKVNPWMPWEVHTSPHDLPGYDEPLFPVAETEIGRWARRSVTTGCSPRRSASWRWRGAEVLIRVSAYMDPWGATPPMDWWTLFNRCRAVENLAYVVAANQGPGRATIRRSPGPAAAWLVDYDGRLLAQADPGPGEKIVFGPIDLAALRADAPAPPRPSSPFPSAGRCLYWSLRPAHHGSGAFRPKPAWFHP